MQTVTKKTSVAGLLIPLSAAVQTISTRGVLRVSNLENHIRLDPRLLKHQIVKHCWPYIDPSTHWGKKNFAYLCCFVWGTVIYKAYSGVKSKQAMEAKQKLEMKPYVVKDALTLVGK